MAASRGFRFGGGIVAIFTGLSLFTAHFFNFLSGSHTGTVFGQTLVFFAHLAAVFAFVGIYDGQGRKNGILGFLGMLLSSIGTMMVSAIVYVEIAGASGADVRLVYQEAVPGIILMAGPLLFAIGMLCVGASVCLANALPRSGGILLIAGTVVFALGGLAEQAELFASLMGAALTCGGFLRLGFHLAVRKPASSDGLASLRPSRLP